MIITGKALIASWKSGDQIGYTLNKASMEAKLEEMEIEIKNCTDPERRKELEREYQEDMQALKEVQEPEPSHIKSFSKP